MDGNLKAYDGFIAMYTTQLGEKIREALEICEQTLGTVEGKLMADYIRQYRSELSDTADNLAQNSIDTTSVLPTILQPFSVFLRAKLLEHLAYSGKFEGSILPDVTEAEKELKALEELEVNALSKSMESMLKSGFPTEIEQRMVSMRGRIFEQEKENSAWVALLTILGWKSPALTKIARLVEVDPFYSANNPTWGLSAEKNASELILQARQIMSDIAILIALYKIVPSKTVTELREIASQFVDYSKSHEKSVENEFLTTWVEFLFGLGYVPSIHLENKDNEINGDPKHFANAPEFTMSLMRYSMATFALPSPKDWSETNDESPEDQLSLENPWVYEPSESKEIPSVWTFISHQSKYPKSWSEFHKKRDEAFWMNPTISKYKLTLLGVVLYDDIAKSYSALIPTVDGRWQMVDPLSETIITIESVKWTDDNILTMQGVRVNWNVAALMYNVAK